jgi:hypothetical protein
MLIRAMPRVVRTHRVEVVLAGCGTDERRLRRLATRLGVSECVQFLGFVGDAQLPGQRGPASLGSHRLQSRQSPAPARLAAHHPELVADEPPATALFKTGGALIRHARYFILQLAESHLTPRLFRPILGRIERLAWHPT